MKIVVMMGGNTPERDVSLRTGAGVAKALGKLGHQVVSVDTKDGGADLYLRSVPSDADLVFIALHGGDGENGALQALLDMAKIPYTGSGFFSSAVTMDKAMSKRIFAQESIPTPPWGEWWAPEDPTTRWRPGLTDADLQHLGGYPIIVKPNDQGSTIGITRVDSPAGIPAAAELARKYGRLILVERFIEGREVTVSVLNGRALPVVEIFPEGGWYDYEHKYTAGASRYECPAALPQETSEKLLALGLKAYRSLRCEGVARVDFRLAPDGTPYCLEVNTVPGMTETSLVPKAAAAAGLSYEDLVREIVDASPARRARAAR
jgi:D-alanine-D-alanine ligase